MAFVVSVHPRIGGALEWTTEYEPETTFAGGLEQGDTLLRWGAKHEWRPLRVPDRWDSAREVLVLRDGKQVKLQLPAGDRSFHVYRVLRLEH